MLRFVERTWTVVTIALLPLVLIGCGKTEVATHTDAVRTQRAEPRVPRHFAAPRDAKPLQIVDPQLTHVAATSTSAPVEHVESARPALAPLAETHFAATPQEEELADSIVPWARPVTRPDRIAAAVHQADARTRKGVSLARRGARLSAKAEFVQALRIVADAMDEARSCTAHRDALARGLTAIEESGDFLSDGARLEGNRTVAEMVAGHRTPILHDVAADNVSAVAAHERYLDYAQEQLAAAARGEPVGSMALYGLGRSAAASQDRGNNGAAMACYQAALSVDRRNFLAANELGVLLARGGNYQAARAHLVASWEEGHHAATLKNLVAVHQKLGETQLASQAERLLVAMRAKRPASSGDQPGIRWTDAASFATTNQPAPPIARAPATPTRPVATTATAPRPESTSWFPWNTNRQR